MVDPNALLVAWIRQAAISALPARGTTGSVYAVDLPDDIDIPAGPAIVVGGRGGVSQTEVDGIVRARIQLDIWDDVFQNARARTLYGLMADWINSQRRATITNIGTIISCYEVQPPHDMSDPEMGFARVVAFYEIFART